MPLGDGITFKYGDYEFSPRPLFTVNKEIIKTPSNTGLGTRYSLTLNGTLLPTGVNIDDNKGGLNTVLTGVQGLRDAFAQDFNLLLLECSDADPIISGYPKVINVDINNAGDNYVRQATYTIGLELPTLIGSGYESAGLANAGGAGDLTAAGLVSLTEDVSIEFLDERVAGEELSLFTDDSLPTVFSINKNITAQGASLPSGNSTYMEPWQRAHAYVKDNLGATGGFPAYFSGAMCVDGLNFTSTFRTISINQTDGSCAGTQTFVAMTGTESAIEDFEGSLDESNDTPFTNVTINGTIQGFTDIDYTDCPPSGTNKFDNAFTKWGVVEDLLSARAEKIYAEAKNSTLSSLNTGKPLTRTVGYNPIAGTVTYSVSYDDRFDPHYDKAVSESISVSETKNRADLYASLTILGRGSKGPLLQKLGTTGPQTRDVSVDAIVVPTISYTTIDNGASTGYNSLFSTPTDGILTSDVETWDSRAGHYTRNASWEIGECS